MTKELVVSEAKLLEAIENNEKEAEEAIQDEDKFEKIIQGVENTLSKFPMIGKYLSEIACLVSLVRNYIKKEYSDVPIKTITSIVATLIYIIAPIDLIPDAIPVIGIIDDIALLTYVLKSLESDIDKYKKWRVDNNILITEQL